MNNISQNDYGQLVSLINTLPNYYFGVCSASDFLHVGFISKNSPFDEKLLDYEKRFVHAQHFSITFKGLWMVFLYRTNYGLAN